jgi:N-methylhydantoinase B
MAHQRNGTWSLVDGALRWEIIHRGTVFIAEEMGVALKRSALSPNIRERVDHSCAVLGAEGHIVAQAEHIPVHLGSFRVGARNLLEWLSKENIELASDDMVLTNEPYISGTHLNDLMVIAPVDWRGGRVGYVVNKAHHVDVGGPKPGSINPNARSIYDEGFVVPPVKVVEHGSLNEEVISMIESNFKAAVISLGDLQAQLAANRMGIKRVVELFEKNGLDSVKQAWTEVVNYGRKLTLNEMERWPDEKVEAEDYLEWMDKLIPLRVKIWKNRPGVIVDFSGTSPQLRAPLNAVFGVTFSAVAFAIRCMITSDVPTNEGFYSTIDARAPLGSLVNPMKPAPVSGGNLETSQRTADLMFKALAKLLPEKVPAAAQGTMMNLMMGGQNYDGKFWAYYETIGAGSGGRPGKSGVSGVHNNMTNTLNTPIEIAERVYPIIFTKYGIREGSHGNGRYPGGDGIVRAFKTKLDTQVSILSDRFIRGPWGLNGGGDGIPGRVTIIRADGKVEKLSSKITVDLSSGDEIIIETPGGGGWGSSTEAC